MIDSGYDIEFERIELLVLIETEKSISQTKVEFQKARMRFIGNSMIITTNVIGEDGKTITEGRIFDLSELAGYRTYK